MEQVLKSKPRSLKNPLTSIVSVNLSRGQSSADQANRKRKMEGETLALEDSSQGPSSSPTLATSSNQDGSSRTTARHSKPHGCDKVYRCKTCSRGYSSPQALGGHQNLHNMERAHEKRRRASSVYGPSGSGSENPNPSYLNPNLTLPVFTRPMVAPTRLRGGALEPTHIGEWPREGPGGLDRIYPNVGITYSSGFHGGSFSSSIDRERDLTLGFEEGDAPRNDDDGEEEEEDVRQTLDLTLKL